MARPGWPERTKAARSLRQFKRFRHVINSDKVFGTHGLSSDDSRCVLAEPRILEANSRSLTALARMTAPTTCERTASARLSLASLDRPNDLLATAAANSFNRSVEAVLTRAGCLARSAPSATGRP